jgi:hypothetical protein
MITARTTAWLAAGFLAGALIGVWNLRRDRAPAAPPAAVAAETPAAVAGGPQGCVDAPEVAARAARVAQLAAEVERLRLDNALGHFHPPPDLPARFSGRSIERTLQSAFLAAGVDAEILGTDCDEYPCVTRARTRSAADLQAIKDHFFDQPAYGGDTKQLARARSDDPREYRFGATIYPSTDPRLGEIQAAFTRRLGLARLGPGSLRPDAPPFPRATIGSPPEVHASGPP